MSPAELKDSLEPAPAAPRPVLSVFDAVMITVGIVIGAGIFKTPSLVAGVTGGVDWMLIAWVLGGRAVADRCTLLRGTREQFPQRRAVTTTSCRAPTARDLSFFFAWARVAVITTGSIALLAFVFGDYMSRVLSLGPHSSAIYAALTVLVLTRRQPVRAAGVGAHAERPDHPRGVGPGARRDRRPHRNGAGRRAGGTSRCAPRRRTRFRRCSDSQWSSSC